MPAYMYGAVGLQHAAMALWSAVNGADQDSPAPG
jgi:hypothetical protein